MSIKEANCRAIAPIFKALDAASIDYSGIDENLPVSVNQLRRANTWIEWETCAILFDRLEKLLGGREAYIAFVRERGTSELVSEFIGRAAGYFLSPRHMLELVVRVFAPSTYPIHSAHYRVIGRNAVEVTLRLPESVSGSETFFWGASAMFRKLPTLLGLPESEVQSEVTSHWSRHLVTLPPSRTLVARIRDLLDGVVSRFYPVRQLLQQESELQSAFQELRETYQQLKAKDEQLKKAEDQLLQVQKMESIAQLSGGVAHDFNNQLTVILGFADMLANTTMSPDQLRQVEAIRQSALRSASLTEKLLAFARKQTLDEKAEDPSSLLEQMRDVIESSVGEQVQVEFELQENVGRILIDSNQLELAVVNIIINAKEALSGPGNIRIYTGSEQDYVVIGVQDNGPGISAADQQHLFEPFFTTKSAGTGLGLAMVHGFVVQSRGEIRLDSQLGSGTTFELRFPRTEIAYSPNVSVSEVTKLVSKSVLILEDEPEVLEVASLILEQGGYSVTALSDPAQAIELFKEGTFDLLISDVVMPHMSGVDVLTAVLSQTPDANVMLMTGYANETISFAGLPRSVPLIRKPFTSYSLLEAVAKAITAGR